MLAGSGAGYTLDLATVTTVAGSYVLTLKAAGSGIADGAGNLLAADASDEWSIEAPPSTNRFDVTGDGAVNVLDILAIVNWMTINGVQPVTPETASYDTTRDGIINSLDILAILNYLTELMSMNEAEGEGTGVQADAAVPQQLSSDELLQVLAEDVAAARRRRSAGRIS
jgi:hypothetical protein